MTHARQFIHELTVSRNGQRLNVILELRAEVVSLAGVIDEDDFFKQRPR